MERMVLLSSVKRLLVNGCELLVAYYARDDEVNVRSFLEWAVEKLSIQKIQDWHSGVIKSSISAELYQSLLHKYVHWEVDSCYKNMEVFTHCFKSIFQVQSKLLLSTMSRTTVGSKEDCSRQ